jgi:hypothetical protein
VRKFSQILESKEDLLSRINADDDNIEEIFIDMVDLGYTYMIDPVYISLSTGYPHRRTRDVKDYYPGIEIELDRTINDKSISDGGSGDVRNWNGSVYFESELNIIDSIYNSIHRIKSMLDGKASVYYSIRNINHITIRIIFDREQSDSFINYEGVEDILKSLQIVDDHHHRGVRYRDLDGARIEGYSLSFDSTWRRPSGDTYEYKAQLRTLPNEIRILNNDLLPSEWAIKTAMDSGKSDNREQLMSLFNTWVTKFYSKIESHELKLVPVKASRPHIQSHSAERGYKIIDNDGNILITIFYWYEEQKTFKIVTEPKRFSRDVTKVFDVYELYFRVKVEK